jgi:hypothetical protein
MQSLGYPFSFPEWNCFPNEEQEHYPNEKGITSLFEALRFLYDERNPYSGGIRLWVSKIGS